MYEAACEQQRFLIYEISLLRASYTVLLAYARRPLPSAKVFSSTHNYWTGNTDSGSLLKFSSIFVRASDQSH